MVPSIEIIVAGSAIVVPLTLIRRAGTSTSSSSAPQTQVFPMPRATTAACEVLPPRLVRTPWAAIMPCRSSGFVSRRTRMTFSPWSAASTAAAEVKTTLPEAAPGEAPIALVSKVFLGVGVEPREHQLGQLRALHPAQRLVGVDHALVDQAGRDPERRPRGPLADPGLQHPQLAALDGELDVAQVAVVAFQLGHDRHQFVVRRLVDAARDRPAGPCCGCRRRRPRPARSAGSRRTRRAGRWPGRG